MPAIVGTLFLVFLLALLLWVGWRVLSPPGPATLLHLRLHRTCTLALPGTSQLLTVDANGDGVENNIVVTSSDPSIATVSAFDAPNRFRVDYLAVGHVDFTATAVNSAGDPISGSVAVDVALPAADALTLTLSDLPQ